MRIMFVLIVVCSAFVLMGCEAFNERFLTEEDDSRLVNNEALPVPASMSRPFGIPDELSVRRGGRVTLLVGYFNDQPMRAEVFVGSPETPIGFGNAQMRNDVFCKDDRGLEYTFRFDSPHVSVSPGEAQGFEVLVADNHNVVPEELLCLVSLFDTQSSQLLYTEELVVTLT